MFPVHRGRRLLLRRPGGPGTIPHQIFRTLPMLPERRFSQTLREIPQSGQAALLHEASGNQIGRPKTIQASSNRQTFHHGQKGR